MHEGLTGKDKCMQMCSALTNYVCPFKTAVDSQHLWCTNMLIQCDIDITRHLYETCLSLHTATTSAIKPAPRKKQHLETDWPDSTDLQTAFRTRLTFTVELAKEWLQFIQLHIWLQVQIWYGLDLCTTTHTAVRTINLAIPQQAGFSCCSWTMTECVA